MYTLIPQEVR
ncbi:hypothetical protein AYI69_g9058, partial [Smittium culicis]